MVGAYERPRDISSLVKLLAETEGTTSLLAGGTDLLVQLRARLVDPSTIIDIKGVEELSKLEIGSDGTVTIGAAVVANRIVDDKRLYGPLRALPQAVAQIATYAIRNRATIVGNLANASPCADSVPPLCVLGASVVLRSSQGERALPLLDFITGVRRTIRRRDEFVAFLTIPPQGSETQTLFMKHQRVRGHDLALANAAVLHDRKAGQLRLVVGSCSPVPTYVNLDDLAGSLDGNAAAERAMAEILPISDVRASAAYRTDMTGVLVRRLIAELQGSSR